MSTPVNALAGPRSSKSDSETPPILFSPNWSCSHVVVNHASNPIDRMDSSQSSSFNSSHAAPNNPMTVLNIGKPVAPARIYVVPIVPKNL